MLNINDSSAGAKLRLICRSLACLHIEIKQNRFATRQGLVKERGRREAANRKVSDSVRQHVQLWMDAGGPVPEQLEDLTPKALKEARDAVATLERRFAPSVSVQDGSGEAIGNANSSHGGSMYER